MCIDYLYHHEDNCSTEIHRRFRLNMPQNRINVACRSSMMQWMQTVVSFIGFEPETVEIAMSYLDRFLQTPQGQDATECRTIFQLCAMTALYVAVKINCAEALTPKLLAELSQGSFEADQFETMEQLMLSALEWRVNPPTGASFVRETFEILPESLFADEEIRQTVLDTAQVQVDWALGDYELVTVKKSVVAFAAVANSLERQGIRVFNLQQFLESTLESSNSCSLDFDMKEVSLIRKALCEALPASNCVGQTNDLDSGLLEDASLKSLDNDIERAPRKSISAESSSPRSVFGNNS